MKSAGKNRPLIPMTPILYIEAIRFNEPFAGGNELLRPDVRKKAAQLLRKSLSIGDVAGNPISIERTVEDFVLDALFPGHHGLEGSRFMAYQHPGGEEGELSGQFTRELPRPTEADNAG